MLTCSELFIV